MCLFAGASIRETALSSKNGKLRSEKDVWMDFRTGVQFPSPPPKGANPNTVFFVKHCFGFVVDIEEVG
jgi:hypothetical protein